MLLKLRDYQTKVINDLKYLSASALFLGTGTGKTITSLELVRNNNTDNLLVICPQNAIKQWKNTIKEHFNHYNVLEYPKSWSSDKINHFLNNEQLPDKVAIVINYDMVHRVPIIPSLIDDSWTIILDEMHRIKNYGTKTKRVKQTKFIMDMSRRTNYKIGLTATPTQGDFGGYIDYYTQLYFLGYLDMSYDEFCKEFVVFENKQIANLPFPLKVVKGYRNKEELEKILKLMSRRYVPKYNEYEPQDIVINFDKPKSYNKMVNSRVYNDLVINNSSRSRIAKKTLTTGVVSGRTMLGDKISYLDNTEKIDWIKDFLNDSDGQVTVLYNYNVELDTLVSMAKNNNFKYAVINGEVKDKNAVLDTGFKVLFGQYQAISEALDGLQYISNNMIFFAMPESSILFKQAKGRIDRIGQTKVPNYYYLVMTGTIDEVIMEHIKNKIDFSEEVLNKLEI